jgi:hypothetical protein
MPHLRQARSEGLFRSAAEGHNLRPSGLIRRLDQPVSRKSETHDAGRPEGAAGAVMHSRASAVRTALTDVADAFLLVCLFRSGRLRRQLQNCGLLAFAQ